MLIKPKDMTLQTNYVYFSVNIIIIEIEVQRKFSNLSKVVEDSKLQSWDSNPGHQA